MTSQVQVIKGKIFSFSKRSKTRSKRFFWYDVQGYATNLLIGRNAASLSSTSRKSFVVGSSTTLPCALPAKRTPPRCRSTSCSYGSECAPLHVIILLPSSLPPVPGLVSMVLTCTAPRTCRLHGFGPPTKIVLESCESLRRSSLDPRASFYWNYSPTVQYARAEADRVLRFARVCMGSWWDWWIIQARVKCDACNAWRS